MHSPFSFMVKKMRNFIKLINNSDTKFTILYVIIFFLILIFVVPDINASEELEEDKFSGRKAVGLFYNSYTGIKISVCLEDINNCVIDNIQGNEYTKNVRLILKQFNTPIYEYVNNKRNTKFDLLYQPTTLLR